MARRKAAKPAKSARSGRKRAAALRSAKRPISTRKAKAQARARKTAIQIRPKKASFRKTANLKVPTPKLIKVARLDRIRRTLEETVQTPPSSLNMDRHGSAARTGRAEIEENLRNHRGMTPDIIAGDVDVDIDDAIGKALGVQYEDNEPLKASEKVIERDKHRWELDPASSEDYKDRK